MAVLLYRSADGQVIELPLRQGTNRLGRSEINDVRVPDASVSSSHCELLVDGEQIRVRDLGSTNGTAINQQPVKEGLLNLGSILRVGHVDLVVQGEGQPTVDVPEPVAPPTVEEPGNLEGSCRNHGNVLAAWRCSKCFELYCEKCVVDGRKFGVPNVKFCPVCSSKVNALKEELMEKKKAEKTFASEMGGAWKYPLRGNGLIIMIGGTIFFVFLNFLLSATFLLAGFLLVFVTGYYFAYAQQVISASAQGDDDLPGWPDFSDYIQDIVIPFAQGIALFAVYLLPVSVLSTKLGRDATGDYLIFWAALGIALFMMPMAWLAVSMHESVMGLSPHFVIPSILKIPGHYTLVVIQLLAVAVISEATRWVLQLAGIPVLGVFLSTFVWLYFVLVMCRMLGALYYINRHELGWFER